MRQPKEVTQTKMLRGEGGVAQGLTAAFLLAQMLCSTALAAWLRTVGVRRGTRARSVDTPAIVAGCRRLRLRPQDRAFALSTPERETGMSTGSVLQPTAHDLEAGHLVPWNRRPQIDDRVPDAVDECPVR